MDLALLGPWLILGGYAVAVVLVYLAQWLERRTGMTGRGRTPSLVLYSLAAAAASETTQWWLDWGTSSSIPSTLWWAVPAIVAVLVWLFAWRQRTWMAKVVADNHGSYFSGDEPEKPSFGILYHRGRPVDSADPAAGFRAALEFDLRGYRISGVQYRTSDGIPRDDRDPGSAAKAADAVDSTYSLVQLRTPHVPTLLVQARSTAEQQEKFGGLEPGEFHPFEDMRITRNAIGAPLPDVALEDFELDDNAFTKRFSLRTNDSAFARAALDEKTRALLLDRPWFRVREVAFHHGSLWTAQSGPLTEDKLFDNAAHLAELATTVPSGAWRTGSGNHEFTEQFVALRDTAPETAAPVSGNSLTAPVNARRRAASRQPLSAVSLAVRTLFVVALAAVGLSLAGNGFLAVTGLAPQVDFTVERVSSASAVHHETFVDGHYDRGGSTHQVEDFRWTSWGKPARGDVVPVSIGPLPWNPLIEGKDIAVFLALLGALALAIGYRLARATYFPKRKRSRPRTASTEPAPTS
ncbi:hypothetical protein [Amycolatopsis sp. CA-230715]|uniref:hypothetical protein n=1 Tax=Amycolatopsis sp. CA-230715 TaxID=2745196 RepID=UPI001C031D3C|nr:hypothetical protein [Amycolatopsis sp. CA-230715]QWF79685.1 hypothetical protein HUW46_03094 [Amycolatopsis sp. CA-230715]